MKIGVLATFTGPGGVWGLAVDGAARNRDGVAIVLVEQDAHWALSLAQTEHLMQGGRLVRSASASALLDDQSVRKAYLGDASLRAVTPGQAEPALSETGDET